ncbi:hypothetical protein BDF21DRAFT_464479 [Thamnidium elegans]|nr:hypothetical protein BDF21DRAFT_464479 [Thamnidium elegans]
MSLEDFVWPPTGNEERYIVLLHKVYVFPRSSRVDEDTLVTYALAHMHIANTYSTVQLIIPPNLIQTETQRARDLNFDMVPNQNDCLCVDVYGHYTFVQYDGSTGPTLDARLAINVIRLNVRDDIPDVPANLLARVQIQEDSVYRERHASRGHDHGAVEENYTVINSARESSVRLRPTTRSQTRLDSGNRRITRAGKRKAEQDPREESSTSNNRPSKKLSGKRKQT